MGVILNMNIETQKQIIEDYNSGLTLRQVADKHNLKTDFKIKKILLENGISLRRRGQNRPQGKLYINKNYFQFIDIPEKAYWVGFLTADGSISKDGYKLTLPLKDQEPIINFKKHTESEHKLGDYLVYDKRTKKSYQKYDIQITSRDFVSHLINLGLSNAKSFTCSMPRIPLEFFSHFLRGLFDGDGCICFIKNGKRKMSLIATKPILDFVQDFLVKNFNFTTPKLSLVAQNDIGAVYKMHINRFEDQQNFLNFIYKDSNEETRLRRKYELAQISHEKKKSGPKPGWKNK